MQGSENNPSTSLASFEHAVAKIYLYKELNFILKLKSADTRAGLGVRRYRYVGFCTDEIEIAILKAIKGAPVDWAHGRLGPDNCAPPVSRLGPASWSVGPTLGRLGPPPWRATSYPRGVGLPTVKRYSLGLQIKI